MARFPCLAPAILLLALAFVVECSHLKDEISHHTDAAAATYHPDGSNGSVRQQDCQGKCAYRCSATSHRKPCMFYCIKCCSKCLCVPSGTYGHKEECPCYNNWKTKQGKPKCP